MDNTIEIDALEQFLLDNPALDNLEALLGEFNVFETLNIINAEIRHSSVLSWLLDPTANHGLGDYFLKQFLKHFVTTNKSILHDLISLFDIETFNFSNIEIRREWRNIDLLIIVENDNCKLLITIENKIKSSEHSSQLQRYREIINNDFKDYLKLFIYLTPENAIPSDENWLPFDYSTIANLIDTVVKNKNSTINEGVLDFIVQYNKILRRYIVGDSEVERICRMIYKKHKTALDLIFQYKPDVQLDIKEYLIQKIQSTVPLISDQATKTYIRFSTQLFDEMIDNVSEGWTKTNRILLYELKNYEERLTLNLLIGPGPDDYRMKLFSIFSDKQSLFTLAKADKYIGKKYHTVFQRVILKKKDYEDATIEELHSIIDKKWDEFISKDLKKIDSYLSESISES